MAPTCLSIIFLAVCVIGPKLSLNILVKFYLTVFLCINVHTNWIIRINLKVLSFVIPTRLIGRFAPDVLFFYCFVLQWLQREDVHKSLVVYIVKQNQNKKLRILIIKKIVDFQNLMKVELCWRQILKFWTSINLPRWIHIHKPSQGHVNSHP